MSSEEPAPERGNKRNDELPPQAPEGGSATLETISLPTIADAVAPVPTEEARLRRDLFLLVKQVFVPANIVVGVLAGAAFVADTVMIATDIIEPADRLIDRSVVMSLIAATVAQVGALFLVMGRNLFPTRDDNGKS